MLTEEEDLAILISNLKSRKIKRNPIKVAESCERLTQLYGSYVNVARKIGLDSPEMIREFEALLRLPPEVKKLYEDGKLKSAVAGYWISRMRRIDEDKKQLAEAIVQRKLTAHDVRDIVMYAERMHNYTIDKCIEIIKESKQVEKQYLIVMKLPDETARMLEREASRLGTTPKLLAKQIIGEIMEQKDILSFAVRKSSIMIRVAEEGFRAMEMIAKKNKVELEDFAGNIIRTRLEHEPSG